ncbi:GNAT family N-acetyltransferase [Olsenella profusa]|uniref:GNAT family N-acetyltransferase n=1 Tax=Olsenella profusa TaxID=138595 RepID=A0ABS2F2U8_9ACTN|nr:GNAT family N-acetyltransferase [Olsenella profusa]MBM6775314.1 GNAT family N-acetyltransferase [Olsenella profusa]
MTLSLTVRAADLLHGALDSVAEKDGWVRPVRFTPAQLRALGSVRAWHPGVFKQMAACTAGVTLEFDTDATRVELEVRMDEFPRPTRGVLDDVAGHDHAPAAPFDGVSADVDGRHLPLMVPGPDGLLELVLDDPAAAPEPGLQRLPLAGMGEPHRVRVWLPCLTTCAVRDVRADGTYLTPVPARERLVVLGDSIAQGFVACDPARTWPALLADHLGLDLLNQGVGAQVFQPGSLAGLAQAAGEVAAVVVEFGENYRFEPCQASRVEREVRTYLYEVAEAFPEAPTWVLTSPCRLEELYPTHPRSCAGDVDAMIASAAAAHPQMRVVDARALLDEGRLPELLADGSDHPDPEGQRMMAERLGFVADVTRDAPEVRRERALGLVEAAGKDAFPLAECLRRGLGEVLLAEKSAVLVALSDGARMVWGTSRRLVRRALTCFGPGGSVALVCGERSLAREVGRATGGRPKACHVAVWGEGAEVSAPRGSARDLRTLTPAYEGAIRTNYSHAEYLAPGQLEAALVEGAFLGGFEQGRLVGFVGENPEGALGALEVLEDHRRAGWGAALVAAQVARELGRGWRPWAEVWPDNKASLALLRSTGFEVRPAERFWVVA